MTRFLCLGLCASVLGLPGGETPKADSAKSEFTVEARVLANTGFVSTVSGDKQANTVIFDNLVQSVERTKKGVAGTHGQTASNTKVFYMEVPYKTDQKSVKMALDVRGYASADPEACLKLIAHAGDKSTVIDVFGQLEKKGKAVEFKGKTKQALLASYPPSQDRSADFNQRIEFTLQPHASKPVCQVTLILIAEHDTDAEQAGGGVIMVDSLDLSFLSPGQGEYAK